MIQTNNPFRTPGKFEQFTAKFVSEDDKKPLLTWFNKFEKVLKKLGTNYQKSSIDPTDALEYYYDKKSPDEAAKARAEGVQLDEYIKKDGARRRCAGGDGRRTGNPVSSTELEERDLPEVVFDFKNQRDAKQFAKDVENSMVGLANSGVERYKGKYRVVITGDMNQKDRDKKAIVKYAKKNNGEFSHASSDVTPAGYGPKGEGRQLKNPKKEVMVVKNRKVIVIDREDLEKYEKRGWELAESMEEAKSVPLVRTGQGSSTKDTHPKRKDGKIERMYQAKDKNEYASLIIGADTSQKGNVYSVQGSEKNKTVTVVFDNDKQRVSYERRMKIKESVELDEKRGYVVVFQMSGDKNKITKDVLKKFKKWYDGSGGAVGSGSWDMSFTVPDMKGFETVSDYVMKKYRDDVEDYDYFLESVDDTTPRPSFTEDDQKLLDFINKNW